MRRPGRFDREVYIPLPDEETRKEIFVIKLKSIKISQNVNLDYLVERTEGYSGAEIEAVCREAKMSVLEEDMSKRCIEQEHFDKALKTLLPRTSCKVFELKKPKKSMFKRFWRPCRSSRSTQPMKTL